MNRQRRKEISDLLEKISGALTNARGYLEDLDFFRDEEDTAYENLPESLQYGERGQAMQDAIDALDDFQSALEMACDDGDTAVEDLREAIGL